MNKPPRTAPRRPDEANIEYLRRVQRELEGKPCFVCDKNFGPFDLAVLMDGERYHADCALTEEVILKRNS